MVCTVIYMSTTTSPNTTADLTVTVQVGGNVREYVYETAAECIRQMDTWNAQFLVFCPENDLCEVRFRGVMMRVWRPTGGSARQVMFPQPFGAPSKTATVPARREN